MQGSIGSRQCHYEKAVGPNPKSTIKSYRRLGFRQGSRQGTTQPRLRKQALSRAAATGVRGVLIIQYEIRLLLPTASVGRAANQSRFCMEKIIS
eukprot:scaffold94110_cov18-Prasinocladus_malaysianus.AAC.1